jgi:hypothetical protein
VKGTLVDGLVWIEDPSSLLWNNGFYGRSERGRKLPDIEHGSQKTQLMPSECMFLLLSFSDRLLEIEYQGVYLSIRLTARLFSTPTLYFAIMH